MRLVPVGFTSGSSKENGRYNYTVYYCAELETFYTRGRWNTNLANPFCMPKVPSELSFSEALDKIRSALHEVYNYMAANKGWSWQSFSDYEKEHEDIVAVCDFWPLEDSEENASLEVNCRPLKVFAQDKLAEADAIQWSEDEYIECSHCGQLVKPDHIYQDEEDAIICVDCFAEAELCNDCGSFIFDGEGTEVNVHNSSTSSRMSTVVVCDGCLEDYTRCTDCGEYYSASLIELSDDEYDICRRCSEYWIRCYDCGTVMRRDDAEYNEENGEWYCPDHYEALRYRIRSYSYKPEPIFHSTAGETSVFPLLYMGVELEIDSGNKQSECVRDILRDNEEVLYIKHDGSLGSVGMELVTHPCTLQYHMEEFPWEAIVDTAKNKYKYRSHDTQTCGLHVHVNRNALGLSIDQQEATIAKIALLMERFWDTLVKFSRRDYSQLHWCKKLNIEVAPDEPDQQLINKIAKSRTICHDDRYYALNLTNRNTIEFRIFRGTLNHDTLMATLQLVENMVLWAREHTVRETLKCSWDDFALYNQYSELSAYLESRSITNSDGESIESHSRYHVGDVVRVRGDISEWAEDNDIAWVTEEMADRYSDTVTITGVFPDPDHDFDSNYYYTIQEDDGCCNWGEDAFENVW